MYSKDTGKDQMLMTMERALTSGQKAGFFFLGFLGGRCVITDTFTGEEKIWRVGL